MEENTFKTFEVTPRMLYAKILYGVTAITLLIGIIGLFKQNWVIGGVFLFIAITALHDALSFALNKIVVDTENMTVKRFLKKDKIVKFSEIKWVSIREREMIVFNLQGERVLTIDATYKNSGALRDLLLPYSEYKDDETTESTETVENEENAEVTEEVTTEEKAE